MSIVILRYRRRWQTNRDGYIRSRSPNFTAGVKLKPQAASTSVGERSTVTTLNALHIHPYPTGFEKPPRAPGAKSTWFVLSTAQGALRKVSVARGMGGGRREGRRKVPLCRGLPRGLFCTVQYHQHLPSRGKETGKAIT